MSTAATSRPVGDNEFPVLLRLPDLNAPAWLPLTAPAVVAPEAATASAAHASIALPSTSKPEPSPSPAPLAAATTVEVIAPAPTTAAAPVSAPPPRSERLARADRTASAAAGQWTLIRQLATGGVLVGGLALTYLLVMGGGSEETPTHIPTAETTLEPPVIETPDGLASLGEQSPIDVTPDSTRGGSDIPEPSPPPDFDFDRKWDDSRSMTSHIEVADTRGRDVPAPRLDGSGADGQSSTATPTGPSQFQGRIGPDESARATPIYQETNPETYLYRPNAAAHTARLGGTIDPAPRR